MWLLALLGIGVSAHSMVRYENKKLSHCCFLLWRCCVLLNRRVIGAHLYGHANQTDDAIKYTKSGDAEVATLLEESTFTSLPLTYSTQHYGISVTQLAFTPAPPMYQ